MACDDLVGRRRSASTRLGVEAARGISSEIRAAVGLPWPVDDLQAMFGAATLIWRSPASPPCCRRYPFSMLISVSRRAWSIQDARPRRLRFARHALVGDRLWKATRSGAAAHQSMHVRQGRSAHAVWVRPPRRPWAISKAASFAEHGMLETGNPQSLKSTSPWPCGAWS